MNFIDLAKKRYSVRKYLPKKVEEEKLLTILESGRIAPTGANKQPQRLLVIKSEEGLEKLSKHTRFYNAPLAIIVCNDNEESWKHPKSGRDIGEIDASIVTDHMMLQACELGLGSLWICWFDNDGIRQEFNIPENYNIVNILAIGYEDCEPKSSDRHDTQRKSLTETVFYEKF